MDDEQVGEQLLCGSQAAFAGLAAAHGPGPRDSSRVAADHAHEAALAQHCGVEATATAKPDLHSALMPAVASV